LQSLAKYFLTSCFTVFNSGFSEASSDTIVVEGPKQADSRANASDSTSVTCYFDDSDAEDDELLYDGPDAPYTPWTDEPLSSPINPTDNSTNISGSEPFLSPTSNYSGDSSQMQRNVRPKLVHPSSPRSNNFTSQNIRVETSSIPGPQKLRVVIKDVAYTTYRAVLYYVGLLACHALHVLTFGPVLALYRHDRVCTSRFLLP
jgi:hypothetical protein